jgi:hypothetical protein
VDVYSEDLRAQKGRIAQLYRDLKPALLDSEASAVDLFGHHARVVHEGLAAAGVPKRTVVKGDGFELTIEVSHYDANL